MTYEYSFDETTAGPRPYFKKDYVLIQESFKLLLGEIQKWNSTALKHGASRKPYELEEAEIANMVKWGEEQLADSTRSLIMIHGISVGSLRYTKAALLLAIRRKEEDVAKKAAEDWPDGVLSSLRETIDTLKTLATKIIFEPSDILWELIQKASAAGAVEMKDEQSAVLEWDVFISHASEDKEEFVRELAGALVDAGLKVWYDEFTLKIGDSLRRSIDRGLAHSRYGIVVISPTFLRKEWPQKELDGLASLEVDGRKVILPVWHEIEAKQVRKYSPTLADRVATSSKKGLKQIVADLLDAMGYNHTLMGHDSKMLPDVGKESSVKSDSAKKTELDNASEIEQLRSEPLTAHLMARFNITVESVHAALTSATSINDFAQKIEKVALRNGVAQEVLALFERYLGKIDQLNAIRRNFGLSELY